MTSQPANPEAILDPIPVDRSIKADAWDAFHAAETPDDFELQFAAIPLPEPAKAALREMKFGAPPDDADQGKVAGQPPPQADTNPLQTSQTSPQTAPKPVPVANTSEFVKAHNRWFQATHEAASKVASEHGLPYDQAMKAVEGTTGIEPRIEDYKAVPQAPEPPEPIPAPEPKPPAQVQRVSPLTPNAPTAAVATTPETPETIALQLEQLGNGTRKAVMFPKGQGQPSVFPPGVALQHDEFGNTYAYRPDLIRKAEISTAAKNNTLPQLLGGPQGMGAPDKSALQGPPIAVAAHGPDGTEAQTTVTDPQSLPQTLAATSAVMPPGGTMGIVPPDQALAARTAAAPVIPPRQLAPEVVSNAALLATFHRTRDLTTALKTYAELSDSEQRLLYRAARNKAFAARLRPEEWTPEARAIAKQYFKVRPYAPRPVPQDQFGVPSPIQ